MMKSQVMDGKNDCKIEWWTYNTHRYYISFIIYYILEKLLIEKYI